MIPYSVLQSDHQPGAFVITVVSARAAQIYAPLLAERFPGNKFAIQEGGAWGAPDCHPSIRDSARSFEVERLAATTLKRDAETNPDPQPSVPPALPSCCVVKPLLQDFE